jgi:hypothetical protein
MSSHHHTHVSAAAAPVPPAGFRLVRTTHAPDGTSTFAPDATAAPFQPFGPGGPGFTVFDQRSAVPADNTLPVPGLAGQIPHCPPAGVLFCVTDFPGGGFEAPMHRTLSLDYAVVLSGEVVLVLDSGEERVVQTGEVVVNQGASHKWVNRGSDRCCMLCVMVGAEKIRLEDGRVLEEALPRPKK